MNSMESMWLAALPGPNLLNSRALLLDRKDDRRLDLPARGVFFSICSDYREKLMVLEKTTLAAIGTRKYVTTQWRSHACRNKILRLLLIIAKD